MKRIGEGTIKIKNIKHWENSRMRDADDVADLMADIEQHGILEPVGIRQNDNTLIFGNRRVKACENLGWDEIPCVYFADVSDEDILILNVNENIKRKNITSIEIGRIVEMLKARGMTNPEIAVRIGISKTRVQTALASYQVTKGTPFEKMVTDKSLGNPMSRKGIPEGTIWKVQVGLTTRTSRHKLTKKDWDILLPAIESGKLHNRNINILKNLVSANDGDLVRSIDMLGRVKTQNIFVNFNDAKLQRVLAKEKLTSSQALINKLLKDYDEDLLVY